MVALLTKPHSSLAGRAGSQSGSLSTSLRSAQAGSFAPGAGSPSSAVAPAARQARLTDSLRNVDLPALFYDMENLYRLPTDFKTRPGYNTSLTYLDLALCSSFLRQTEALGV